VTQITGSCHCKSVQFEVDLLDGLTTARRCTCSFCRMRGAVAVSAAVGKLRILTGEARLSLYTFNTGVAKHYFCSVCGIYTHHQRRSNPNEYGVNVACLEGVSPFDFTEIVVMDGENHEKDTGKSRVAGVLTYKSA
jgi:hypothetical protein